MVGADVFIRLAHSELGDCFNGLLLYLLFNVFIALMVVLMFSQINCSHTWVLKFQVSQLKKEIYYKFLFEIRMIKFRKNYLE